MELWSYGVWPFLIWDLVRVGGGGRVVHQALVAEQGGED
jgi:hypothetical protein